MAQISAVITTSDSDFRVHLTQLLRTSGLPIGVVDEKHLGPGTAPDMGVIDIRGGHISALERFRTSWPQATIFAVAATSEPDRILEAMRAGANEYVTWDPVRGHLDDSFQTALRRTAERTRPRGGSRSGVTLSFFGAKGGAGTTTLAVNCAIEITRLSKRPTLIVDLHRFLGEVALFLGVRPRFTLIDAIDNLHRLDQEFLKELVVRHKSGLDILAGGDQIDRPGPQDVSAIEQLLQTLGRFYDFIVVDVGSITGGAADPAVYAAETIYLVANPDIASIRNAHRLIDRFQQLGAGRDRVRVLMNRMSDQTQIAPKQIETTLGHSLHMMFPSDYGVVSAAMNSGVPLTLSNHSELAARFAKFTREIVHPNSTTDAEDPKGQRSAFLGLF